MVIGYLPWLRSIGRITKGEVMIIRLTTIVAAMAGVTLAGTAGATVYPASPAPIALGAVAYTQNFDTLANSGSTGSVLPAGWQVSENGSNANQTYAVGTGSANAGNVYSFGSAGSSERALGSLTSGSLSPVYYGALFTNALGTTLDSLTVSFTGEQWRRGNTPVGPTTSDRLNFQYRLAAGNLDTGSWITVDDLAFLAPSTATTEGLLNGNLDANRTALSATIGGLGIASGATFAIRWVDLDATGADDGLAIDDVSVLAAPVSAVPEPASWALMLTGFGLAGAMLRRRRATLAIA
jgi:hypothetical protein